jgi:hypothetical protein
VLRVYLIEDIESVVVALKKEGYGMVDHKELFRRLNPIEAAQQSVQSDGFESPQKGVAKVENDPRCLASGGIRRR